MAHTTPQDLASAPVELLLAAVQERQPRMNSIWNSPLLGRTRDGINYPDLAMQTGATKIDIPLISPVEGGYTGQNPGTPPVVDNITSDRQDAPLVYREKAWGIDALAQSQSGLDLWEAISKNVLNVRFDGAESMFLAELDGIFKSTDFADLIYPSGFTEDPVGTGTPVYFDADQFIDMVAIFGIKEADLNGGVITMHPRVRANLRKLDELDTIKSSEPGSSLDFYRGMRVVVDNRLVRNGTTSGKVYPVTICAPGTVLMQIGTQTTNFKDKMSSSLAWDTDVPNLRTALYDRIVMFTHVNGTVWSPGTATGGALTVPKSGPTDTQLAMANAWKTAYTNVLETRIVRGYFNG